MVQTNIKFSGCESHLGIGNKGSFFSSFIIPMIVIGPYEGWW